MSYYKQLKEEYTIPLNESKAMDWYEQDKKQRKMLLENYGDSSWNINSFANKLMTEVISESHFRELVRMEMDKCFRANTMMDCNLAQKNIKNSLNNYKSKLKDETQSKLSKVIDKDKVRELEIRIETLNKLL